MKRDGLVLCELPGPLFDDPTFFSNDRSRKYVLDKFARLRGYLSVDELGSILTKRFEIQNKIEKEFEEKYITKYGPDKSKWSDEVKEMYDSWEDPE